MDLKLTLFVKGLAMAQHQAEGPGVYFEKLTERHRGKESSLTGHT